MAMVNKVIPEENHVENTAFSSIRGNLLTAEQRFVKRVIGSYIISKSIPQERTDIYNVSEFDIYFDDTMAAVPGLKNEFDVLYSKIMNEDGTFKIYWVKSIICK